MVWKVADAKNKFSEVMTLALTEGPQEVQRRDGNVVVISKDEFERLKGKEPDFLEFLRSCPDLSDVDVSRDTRPLRDLEW
jgi:prevent-host-death family protein